MTDQVLAASVFELLTGSGLLVVAFFAWNKRQNPAGVPLVVMAVAISCWALASGLQPHVPSDTVTHALSHATHLLAALAALAWFYVAVEYTDTTELQGRQLFVAILSLWVVDFVLVVTDPVHMLFTTPESRVADAGYYVHEIGGCDCYRVDCSSSSFSRRRQTMRNTPIPRLMKSNNHQGNPLSASESLELFVSVMLVSSVESAASGGAVKLILHRCDF
jgi:hypothetical protein